MRDTAARSEHATLRAVLIMKCPGVSRSKTSLSRYGGTAETRAGIGFPPSVPVCPGCPGAFAGGKVCASMITARGWGAGWNRFARLKAPRCCNDASGSNSRATSRGPAGPSWTSCLRVMRGPMFF